MAKKKTMKRKKVLQAAKQRRKARLGGVFARAADRRKRFREKEPAPTPVDNTAVTEEPPMPTTTTITSTESSDTGTANLYVGNNEFGTTTTQPAQTTQRDSGETTESTEAEETIPPRPKQSDYQKRGRYGTTVDDVDAYEAALLSWEQTYGVLKGTDIGTGTGTTGTGTTGTGTGTTGDAMVDQTTRQQRITDTAARTEALAKGNFEESGITIPTERNIQLNKANIKQHLKSAKLPVTPENIKKSIKILKKNKVWKSQSPLKYLLQG